ncbi:c-type cytochrome biogenesis protein CcmI [Marinobacter sp. Arc7-DN-1]|uniref:c-type cytochrome biogenesis protein CcmI n=1 Tax=Marinobacter sp. Arc7-DN-1 TaxID=2304594 RepID=UPI000E43AC8A|nr:c-type cytochrome biogenesis protein CcmI [Marinobacter sp. Arc7-DN-1]AXS82380.1 c-type cytochrome biogenesis protein CcmI [Marinobacter sp. Arc7-DN-1]
MTQTFWIAATVLIIIALAFVLYPVFFHRTGTRKQTDLKNQNLMAYRSRMKELDREYEAGILDDENYHQLKEELAGAMLDDVPEDERPRPVISGRGSAMAVALVSILLVPAAAFYLYQQWGAMDGVEQFITMQEMGATDGARQAQMAELSEQLRERLEASPDNPEGWAMLGRTYMSLERYDDAAWAFRQLASTVKEDDRAESVAYGLAAQALFFGSQGAMTEEVTGAIEQARELNPDEVNVLGLLGINAFSQQNYREAIEYWERIETVAPDHPQIASIREGIREAYTRLGEKPPELAAESEAAGTGVTVRVTLIEAFRDQVPAHTTLFLFARQAGAQQGPPLAVARLTADQLPAEIRLDDSYSMSPQARISDAEEVVITARLSRSGSVSAQPGDWQGSTDMPVAVGDGRGEPVAIVIDQQLTN